MEICKKYNRNSDEYGMVTMILSEKEAPMVLCNESYRCAMGSGRIYRRQQNRIFISDTSGF
ncbi:MAG TPA: hypothetical protein GX707_00385 [Epulopiscium sp.]|nr:hypothetical protein [Candidatus Epulonipiscium sp.]